ncbi:MAG: hypothetical protein ABI566_00635 [Pseudolysinimonas sp.]
MAKAPPPPPMPDPAAPPAALRAQILATEHWSLLASRSTTQNEVLGRISIFLTFVSAVLVSLALIGQATSFGAEFPLLVLALLSIALLVGLLTQVRVFNVAAEDLMYVIAMNRLRAGYAELAPGIEKWFMTSAHDDQRGSEHTYYFFENRGASVVFGSSAVFIGLVNASLLGLLIATIALVSGAQIWLAVTGAAIVAVAFVVTSLAVGYRVYVRTWQTHQPLSPTPRD